MLSQTITEYRNLRNGIQKAMEALDCHPDLSECRKELLSAVSDLQSLVLNRPGGLSIEETRQEEDFFALHDPVTATLRRQRAKVVARRLYPLVHPDRTDSPPYSFGEIRSLVNSGELEVLFLMSVQLNAEPVPPKEKEADLNKKIETMSGLLRARMSMWKSSEGYRLSRLLYSNQEDFVTEAKEIYKRRIEKIRSQVQDYLEVKHES